MARKSKTAKKVEINPGVSAAATWVVGMTGGNNQINADELKVTEGGALIFLISGSPICAIGPHQYTIAFKT